MGSLLREQIVNVILDVSNGLREGTAESRRQSLITVIDQLLGAKVAGLNEDAIMATLVDDFIMGDKVRVGIDAALASKMNAGVSGGVQWQFISAMGNYETQKAQEVRVRVDQEFMSVGAADFSSITMMSVDELNTLREQLCITDC